MLRRLAEDLDSNLIETKPFLKEKRSFTIKATQENDVSENQKEKDKKMVLISIY